MIGLHKIYWGFHILRGLYTFYWASFFNTFLRLHTFHWNSIYFIWVCALYWASILFWHSINFIRVNTFDWASQVCNAFCLYHMGSKNFLSVFITNNYLIMLAKKLNSNPSMVDFLWWHLFPCKMSSIV